jgi:hypothetical protein
MSFPSAMMDRTPVRASGPLRFVSCDASLMRAKEFGSASGYKFAIARAIPASIPSMAESGGY